MKKFLLILLAALLCCSCASPDGPPDDIAIGQVPISDTLPPAVEAAVPGETDAAALAEFGLDLLRADGVSEGNRLISPVSIVSALGMTAVGARGQTLAQMEAVMGLDLPRLRAILPSLSAANEAFGLANAIWYRDRGVVVNEEFAQICQDEFGAPIKPTPMDSSTCEEVNGFVDDATRGMIPKLLDPDALRGAETMLLVNALAFEADWQVAFDETRSYDGIFDGVSGQVHYLRSTEDRYLEGKEACGFIKFYDGGRYAFAAILPDKSVTLDDYVASLDGEALIEMINSASIAEVYTALPVFGYDDTFDLVEPLKSLGMVDAFSDVTADLSGIGQDANGKLYISGVTHKTHIELTATGTEAAAATVVTVEAEWYNPDQPQPKYVYLSRPFLYAILDMTTDMPLFIGTVREPVA